MSADRHIRYAHPGHREFNKRFDPPEPAPVSLDIHKPWMSAETLKRLPLVRLAFDRHRGEAVPPPQDLPEGKQVGKSETEKTDRPQPELKPSQHMRGQIDREMWLKSQLEEALAHAAPQQGPHEAIPERAHVLTGPLPGRSR